MNTPSPKPTEIAKCPNPECNSIADLWVQDDGPAGHGMRFCVQCCCGYTGPSAATEADAIRLHNALCAPALAPFEKLIPELRAKAEENKSQSTYFVGWGDACDYLADRLSAVVEEVRGK